MTKYPRPRPRAITATSMTPYLLLVEFPSLVVTWEGPADVVELLLVVWAADEPVAVLIVVFAVALALETDDEEDVWTRTPPDADGELAAADEVGLAVVLEAAALAEGAFEPDPSQVPLLLML